MYSSRGGLTARLRPLDDTTGQMSEQCVPGRQAAEEDAEHSRRRLGVGPEENRQVLLPGHLVDEAREARE